MLPCERAPSPRRRAGAARSCSAVKPYRPRVDDTGVIAVVWPAGVMVATRPDWVVLDRAVVPVHALLEYWKARAGVTESPGAATIAAARTTAMPIRLSVTRRRWADRRKLLLIWRRPSVHLIDCPSRLWVTANSGRRGADGQPRRSSSRSTLVPNSALVGAGDRAVRRARGSLEALVCHACRAVGLLDCGRSRRRRGLYSSGLSIPTDEGGVDGCGRHADSDDMASRAWRSCGLTADDMPERYEPHPASPGTPQTRARFRAAP